jgi:hypothetical protein
VSDESLDLCAVDCAGTGRLRRQDRIPRQLWQQLDAAWHELDLAKAEGFAGTVSYSKALSLLTAAKTQQQFEGFEGCTKKAEKARFYIRESRAGR